MTGYWYFTIRRYPNGRFLGESWRCSECGSSAYESARFPSHGSFCHNCGTKMEEEPKLIIKDIPDESNVFTWE